MVRKRVEAQERSVGEIERLAYTLVERARIRCEQVLEEPEVSASGLQLTHRHLGLAGYHISTDFHPAVRIHRLGLARQGCDAMLEADARGSQVDDEATGAAELDEATGAVPLLMQMLEETVGASDALAKVLIDRPREHVHTARAHVNAAVDLLHGQLADARVRHADQAVARSW